MARHRRGEWRFGPELEQLRRAGRVGSGPGHPGGETIPSRQELERLAAAEKKQREAAKKEAEAAKKKAEEAARQAKKAKRAKHRRR